MQKLEHKCQRCTAPLNEEGICIPCEIDAEQAMPKELREMYQEWHKEVWREKQKQF